MYLSDRDIAWAIQNGDLILPPDATIDPTSVDLHLDSISEAKIWNMEAISQDNRTAGHGARELRIGKFKYVDYAEKYLRELPNNENDPVYVRGSKEVVVKHGGFV